MSFQAVNQCGIIPHGASRPQRELPPGHCVGDSPHSATAALLEMIAAPAPINRRTFPPQSGQVRSGLAVMFWNFSNRRLQSGHSYSYVGIIKFLPNYFDTPRGGSTGWGLLYIHTRGGSQGLLAIHE